MTEISCPAVASRGLTKDKPPGSYYNVSVLEISLGLGTKVPNPLEVTLRYPSYQTCIMIHRSKMTVTKQQHNNFMAGGSPQHEELCLRVAA